MRWSEGCNCEVLRLVCWMWVVSERVAWCPWSVPAPSRLTRVGAVRTVDGRPLLIGGGLSGERYPSGSAHLDRQARLPRPRSDRKRGGRPRVRGAAGCGHGDTGPGVRPVLFGGGFSAGLGRVFVPHRGKTLLAPGHRPTEPHRPGDGRLREPRSATRPVEKSAVPRPHPPAGHHPTHTPVRRAGSPLKLTRVEGECGNDLDMDLGAAGSHVRRNHRMMRVRRSVPRVVRADSSRR